MLEVLMGMGLSTSAGLNAYIPLMVIGLLGRFTELITLPAGWNWLENNWTLGILAVLLTIEFLADKFPVVDSFNDIVQTVVRPASGGLAFGASSDSTTVAISDPGQLFSNNQWIPIALGILISLGVHSVKSVARPIANTATAGMAAPVISTIEDVTSVALSLVAIIIPILVLLFLIGITYAFWRLLRRIPRRQSSQ